MIGFVILREAKNRSWFLCLHSDRREILRFAQNDNGRKSQISNLKSPQRLTAFPKKKIAAVAPPPRPGLPTQPPRDDSAPELPVPAGNCERHRLSVRSRRK